VTRPTGATNRSPRRLPTTQEVSARGRAVRRAGTKTELLVADALRQRRYKMLLNVGDLLAAPDAVLPRKKISILVQGCF
jgi:G:T-mismatch repair DNA endonuclease (very short patch repair protein)